MNGVLAAMLTPQNEDGSICLQRFTDHGKRLLSEGCDGLVPFGTTGEFPCFTVSERMAALDAMISGGIPAQKIIVGTGACALPDMAVLSRHAMDHDCAGVLAGPPFYFKQLSNDAIFETYAGLIKDVGNDIRLYLYHFPEMSSVPIPISVIERLHHEYPRQLSGLKDSAGDIAYSQKLIDRFPDLKIFTGDDDLLLANLQAGGAGSITAGSNIAVRDLCAVRDNWRSGAVEIAEEKDRLLRTLWSGLLLNYPVTEALKEIFAAYSGSDDWLTMRLPLVRLNEGDRKQLLDGFSKLELDISPDFF
jgi:4-hydroxy-tetrahydrodipicolinate synthase|tara:strand:- start:937 stop:1848 length:912 start_codon:yes stop_codon:yes gene_type:complete